MSAKKSSSAKPTAKKPSKKLVVKDLENLKGGLVTTEVVGEAEGVPLVGKSKINSKTVGPSSAAVASSAGRVAG